MTPEPMPEPEGPDDDRFIYVVTAAGVEALRESAAAFDSEREVAEALERAAERSPDGVDVDQKPEESTISRSEVARARAN